MTLSVNLPRLGSFLTLSVRYLAIVLTVSAFRSLFWAFYSRYWRFLWPYDDIVERKGDLGWGKEGTASKYSTMLVFSAGFVPTKGEK